MSIDVDYLKEILIKKGETLEEGLSDEEFKKIENCYSIKFPTSLRTLYKLNHFCLVALVFIIGGIFPKIMLK